MVSHLLSSPSPCCFAPSHLCIAIHASWQKALSTPHEGPTWRTMPPLFPLLLDLLCGFSHSNWHFAYSAEQRGMQTGTRSKSGFFLCLPSPTSPPPSLRQPPSAVYKLSTFLCFCRSHLGYSGHLWYKLWIYETSNWLLPAYNAWHCHCLLRVLVSDVLNVKVNFIDTELSALISFPIAFFWGTHREGN